MVFIYISIEKSGSLRLRICPCPCSLPAGAIGDCCVSVTGRMGGALKTPRKGVSLLSVSIFS